MDFPHMGCTVAYNNSYWAALYQNLWKLQIRWEMVGKVVSKTGETVQTRGMLYEAAVHLVLLYWSESWVVTGAMLKLIE